ncbi:hypothetical protein P43SY_000307 [Pythium insidiosum]|uniref:Multidrug/Oligosaccharidyl-lipid/Polysaccharide (MOP) Flippase Superfamily n=1 Tax=Pythium insidiosum TaxID=114742 RepID=A0AAD5LGJ2_PYTIN|nr:hypothetical protein P43SY_000307 [Pythium insidiosum]
MTPPPKRRDAPSDTTPLVGDGATGPSPMRELRKLSALAAPIMLTYVLEFLPGVVSLMLVGRMASPQTKEFLDGATLSSMFIYLSGEAPGFGLATALDTLCSQAHGAGRPRQMGISFQTGVLVLAVAFVPVALANWYTESWLLALHQPAEVAALAGRFSRLLVPGLPFLFLYELLKKVLQAQNVVAPMVHIAVLSNVVNILLGIYLTWYTPWGYDGAAIARTVSNVVLPLATLPYFWWRPEALTRWWPGWQPLDALRHVPAFLTLGVPGMFMLVLEWLSYEVMAVLAGLLPDSVVAISVHSVLSTLANIGFHCFIGAGVATNVLVGNYVGSGQRRHAQLATQIGVAVSLAIAVILVVVIIAGRALLPELLINDAVAITHAAAALIVLIPFELLDAINTVLQGVFRGTGHQTFAAALNLCAYMGIGLPCGCWLAFRWGWGVQGLWLGLSVGYAVCVTVSVLKIARIDWDAMTRAAKERLRD